MTAQQYEAEPARTRANAVLWKRLRRTGGVAAYLVGILFLIAALDLLRVMLQPGVAIGWADWLQNNWLMVIIKLHAGFQDVLPDMLYRLNFLDVLILLLVGIAFAGLFAALRRVSRIWSAVALALPFFGLLLFLITQSAGRSAVMGAVLVISFVIIRSRTFSTNTAVQGIFASALLLVGDFTVGSTPGYIFGFLTGLGYVLMTMWFFSVGQRLLTLKRRKRTTELEEQGE